MASGCPAGGEGLAAAVCDLRRRSKDTERTVAELARKLEKVAAGGSGARDTGLDATMVDILENGEGQWFGVHRYKKKLFDENTLL